MTYSGYPGARTYIYNEKMAVTKVSYPDGTEENFVYDACNQLLEKTGRTGATTRMEYDSCGHLAKEILPEGLERIYTYEVMERITQIINEWDPIGFFPMAPKDEYINEIKKINEFVCSNYSLQVDTLAQKINKIFVETFGTDVYDEDLEQCTIIAKRILKLEME